MSISHHPQSATDFRPASPIALPEPSRAPRIGLLLVLSVPAVASLLNIDGITIAGFNYILFALLAYLALTGVVLAVESSINRRHGIPLRFMAPWLLFLGWTWISIAWADGGTIQNHVQFLLQMSLPAALAVLAARFVENETHLRWLLVTFGASIGIAVLAQIIEQAGLLAGSNFSVRLRETGLGSLVLGAVALAAVRRDRLWPLIGWGLCLAAAFFAESRLVTGALFVLPLFHPALRRPAYRFWIIVAFVVACLGALSTPKVQELLFVNGSGINELERSGTIASAGRFHAWPLIIEHGWEHHPALGAGPRATSDFVPTVWETMQSPHNELIRVFFDYGLIGLGLFVFAGIWQAMDLFRRSRSSSGLLQTAFIAGFLAFVAVAMGAMTDNPLGYGRNVLNPLFVLLGAAYGLEWRRRMGLNTSAD